MTNILPSVGTVFISTEINKIIGADSGSLGIAVHREFNSFISQMELLVVFESGAGIHFSVHDIYEEKLIKPTDLTVEHYKTCPLTLKETTVQFKAGAFTLVFAELKNKLKTGY